MTVKQPFQNVAKCVIGGKQPGERFLIAVLDDGKTPAEIYWRKRLAEGAVIYSPPDAAEQPKAKASRVAKASTSTTDKGAA